MPRQLDIRLLGSVELRLGGTRLPLPEAARALSLLAYLLVHRGSPQPRRRVAFLLWPDSTEAQARTNLRKALHTLRHALPDGFLDGDTQTLRWRADAPFTLDVSAFEAALARGELRAAVAGYGGDLLDGSYDEWVLEERERLRDRYAEALEQLAEEPDGLEYAERLVRLDPLREAGTRALMRLHAARGDRVRAMRAYHAYAALAQRELGIVPAAVLRQAYEALLEIRPPTPSTRTPPLIGRAAESERLRALWDAATRGHAQLALVTGEAGIGKSRLVEHLRTTCGATSAEARAYAAEGSIAYGPVVTWLRSDALAPRLRRLDPAHADELARLLPELAASPPAETSGDEWRTRLFAAVAHALLGSGAPLLLVADDLQYFDAPTLQFLHYLLRSPVPLLVAATARREELDAGHPVLELATGLQTLGRCTEIALGRLTRVETRQLAEQLRGAPLDGTEAERLLAASEGNPLYLVEAAQTDSAPAGRVQAMIAARLARLSPPAAELAGVAATIGREFSAPVLAEAAGVEDRAFARGLDELWRRGIVRAHEHDLYDFSHGRIREAAYARIGPAQRRAQHLRVAHALERAGTTGPGVLAAQYEAAGASEEALGWYLRAADAAQRLFDHAGAVRALERALALCAGRPERELEVLTALPAPLNALDGYRSDRLERVHERAFALAAELGVDPEPPLVRSRAVAALTGGDFDAARAAAEQLRRAARHGPALTGGATGDASHGPAPTGGAPGDARHGPAPTGGAAGDARHGPAPTRGAAGDVLLVEGEWILAIAAYWSGRLEPAKQHLEAALAHWRPEHRAEHLLRYGQDTELTCRIRLAHTQWLLGDRAAAATTRDAALAGLGEHAHTRAIVHLWAALIALDERDEASLRAHAEVVSAHARGPAERPAEALAGFIDALEGRGAERVRRVVDAAARSAPAAPGEPGLLARIHVEACVLAGDPETGRTACEQALRTSNAAQPWTAEIERLQARFERGERFRNGWAERLAPSLDDLPDHHI